jgi:hypothetical protein
MSLLGDGIDDDWSDIVEMGAIAKRAPMTLGNPRRGTQQKSVTQQKSDSIGPDIPWKKILVWGAVSAGGLYVGHKLYQHYTAKPVALPPIDVNERTELIP